MKTPKNTKLLKILVYSSLISASTLGVFNANAGETGWVMSSLVEQAKSLGIAETPDAVATEAAAWQSVAAETPGAAEQNFWDDLFEGAAKKDNCKGILLPIEYAAGNIGSVAGSANRRFHRYPDKTLALVDELGLNVGFNSTKPLLEPVDTAGVSITGGARLEGSSIVIRPLDGKTDCGSLKQLITVLKYKTVLPFKAERFAAMKNGEVWKLPLTLWTGFTPGVSGEYGNVNVTVSFGVESQRLPSVSLARISDHELRVRLRIDQARIVSYGGSVGVTLAPVVTGLDNLGGALTRHLGGLVGGAASRIIASKFEEYTYMSFGISHSKTKGKKVLLEFVLDPRNKEQMDALVKLLKDGELSNIGALAKLAGMTFLPGHNNTTDETELQNMQTEWNNKLGITPTYSGQNAYSESATAVTLHIPLLTDSSRTSGHNDQTVHTPGSDETLHVNENFRETSHDRFHTPFRGTMGRHNSEMTVSVFNREAAGKVSEPVMVYEQLEGTIRHSENNARGMLDSVNEIMRFVGVQGEGNNSTAAIPVNDIQPRQAGGRYRAAFMSFAVMFDENAVADIIAAPAGMIVKAFANSLDSSSSAIMKKVLSISTIGSDGRIKYNQRDFERVLGVALNALQENLNLMHQVHSVCLKATQIVTDLIKIRTAPDWEIKSALLSKVIAGDSKSGLHYADILKVLVQVVDPKDVAAEMLYRTQKKAKGQDDVSVQYSYNHEDNPAFAGVDSAKETMDHFDDPARLFD